MRSGGKSPDVCLPAIALLALGLAEAANAQAQAPSGDAQAVRQQALSEAEAEFDDAEEQGQVPLDESFGGLSEREKRLAQRKRALRDTQFDVQLRSYYLDRQWFDDTHSEALAIGGAEAKRAFDAMMGMTKIDVAAIEAARRG